MSAIRAFQEIIHWPANNLAAETILVEEPEQSRYTMTMTLLPDDPTCLQEIYIFISALRRPLRLSSSARPDARPRWAAT
jgi:hypothetical protein